MLEGFTLFHGNKGWQLSIKQAGVDGWSVRHIPPEDAEDILAAVERNRTVKASEPVTEPKHKRRVLVLE